MLNGGYKRLPLTYTVVAMQNLVLLRQTVCGYVGASKILWD